MKLIFRQSFARDLATLRDAAVKRRLAAIIDSIEHYPSLFSIPNLKRLRGRNHYYRVRLGDYRLGLEIKNATVYFVRFLHRREIYRYFP